jgi:hypothetical protein
MGILTQTIITAFGFNIGQLYVRINNLDGSLDKPWLLLPFFWIPPLSFVPAGFVFFNKIEKGSTGSPFEYSMLFAILSAIFVPIILNKIEYFSDGSLKTKVLGTLIMYISVFISLYLRENNICKDNVDSFRILRNVSIANVVSIIIPTFIYFIPIFGNILSVIGLISDTMGTIIDGVLKGLSYMFVILILNMYQGTYLDKYCGDKENKTRVLVFSVICIIISLLFS